MPTRLKFVRKKVEADLLLSEDPLDRGCLGRRLSVSLIRVRYFGMDPRGGAMTNTDADGPGFSKLVSGPGIAAVAILGVAVLAASRLLGSETILREVVTEVIASFGNAILILAVLELYFRVGIERLVRKATGSDAYAQSTKRVRETLQGLGPGEREEETSAGPAKLDSIEEDLKSLVDRDLPELKRSIEQVRKLILEARPGGEG